MQQMSLMWGVNIMWNINRNTRREMQSVRIPDGDNEIKKG